jgi:general secretion pathway protein D
MNMRMHLTNTIMIVVILTACVLTVRGEETNALPATIASPVAPLQAADEIGPIVLAKMDIEQVLDLLQTYSGRVIIPASNLPKEKVTFKSAGKLRRDEAIHAIETLLSLNGVTLIQRDQSFIEAVPSGQALRKAPPLMGEEGDVALSGQQIMGQIYDLQYADARFVQRQLSDMLSGGGISSSRTLDWRNAVLVFDTAQNLEKITQIVEMLDKPVGQQSEVLILPIKNSSANSVYYAIIHAQRYRANAALFRARFHVDRSANHIVVVAPPDSKAYIEELVQQLDREIAPLTTSQIFKLKEGNITTVYNILRGIIRHQQSWFRRQGFQSPETYRITQELPVTTGVQATAPVAEAPSSTPPVDVVISDLADATSELQFSPYMGVWLDRQNDALVAYGTPADMKRVAVLVEQLDTESAPYTRSKVYYLKHADSYGLSRVISTVINSQRRIFQRRGLRSGDEQSGGAPDVSDMQAQMAMGFEFSDFATVVADRRSNSILLYGTATDIERVDEIISEMDIAVEPITSSRVFALRHAQANSLARILQIIVSSQRRAMREVESAAEKVRNPQGTQTDATNANVAEGDLAVQFSQFLSIVPDSRNNAVIVYGTHRDIEHVANLIEQTDVEVVPVTKTEVFFLENARSRTLASILGRMIRSQQYAMRQVRSLFREVQYRGKDDEDSQPQPILYDPNESMQFSPYVSVVANDRNNSLLVYGTDADIDQLRGIIKQNDVAVAPRTQSRVFHIRHADANDVVRTINPLIASQQRVRERESTLRRFFRQQNGDDEESLASGPSDATSSPEDAGSVITGSELEFDEDLQFSPYVSLSPDDRSNSIIVYGTPFDLEQVENLIEQIDRVLPQVRIEVVIAEVMLQEGQVSGLDSFGLSYRNPFQFQIDGAANGGVISESGVIANVPGLDGGSSPAGDLSVGVDLFSLQTVFRTAKDDSNVRILSAPAITTTHNRPASINVGEARPIITSSTTSLDNSLASRSTIEYRDIGIELNVRPLVTEQGYIQMEIEQTVETVIDTQTIDNNEQPIIGTRRANSFVSVRDAQTIVMGGLQSEATIVSEGRVWLLGDIPLLGRLFRPKRSTSTVRELIIFIRPNLVSDMSNEAFQTQMEEKRGLATDDVVIYLENGQFAGQLQAEEEDDAQEEPVEADESSVDEDAGVEPEVDDAE